MRERRTETWRSEMQHQVDKGCREVFFVSSREMERVDFRRAVDLMDYECVEGRSDLGRDVTEIAQESERRLGRFISKLRITHENSSQHDFFISGDSHSENIVGLQQAHLEGLVFQAVAPSQHSTTGGG